MDKYPQISTVSSELFNKLTLPKEAVGHKITQNVPLVYSNHRIGDVTGLLERKKFETINYIYVVSPKGRLRGVFSIAEVYRNPPSTKVSEIMVTKLHKVHPQMDQERAAHIAIKNSLKALPVVDDKGVLLGVLSSDQILSILQLETHEDYMRLAGIVGKASKFVAGEATVVSSFKQRVPWIMIGTLGGFITASVITRFDNVLEKNIVLASFIPLIAYIANAVGTQTQTLYIRDLAVKNEINTNVYTIKQFGTSALIAASAWMLICLLTLILWGEIYIGGVIGLAAFLAIMNATFFAILIPRLLAKFNMDPATGSGPLPQQSKTF